MAKRKKRVGIKNYKISNRKDKLSVAVFFCSAYLSLNFLESNVWFHISGILLLICALIGVVSLYRGKKFIFDK